MFKRILRNLVTFLATTDQIDRMRQAVIDTNSETLGRAVLLAEGGRMSWEHAGIEASVNLAKELEFTRRELKRLERAIVDGAKW